MTDHSVIEIKRTFVKRLVLSFNACSRYNSPLRPKDDSYFFAACSLSTFLTIFCSSTRNARTILSRTAPPDKTPPYERVTLFLFFAMCLFEYAVFATRGTPWIFP